MAVAQGRAGYNHYHSDVIMASLYKPVCDCSSYSFPHRAGGGRCSCSWSIVKEWDYLAKAWRTPYIKLDELCEGCGQPAETSDVDFGIGAYEYWGAPGVDVNVQNVTDCCEMSLVSNSRAEHVANNWEIVK